MISRRTTKFMLFLLVILLGSSQGTWAARAKSPKAPKPQKVKKAKGPSLKGWKKIESGFYYRFEDDKRFHAFLIDPNRFRFDVLLAQDYKVPGLSADTFREKSSALLVINGGFFDQNLKPLGLLIQNGIVRNPLRKVNWGIFAYSQQDGGEKIYHTNEWKPEIQQKSWSALQVGPRLVVNGQKQIFKESLPTRRSAVGLTKEGWVIIAMTENSILLSEWADWLKAFGDDVLNLDGGSSSQISINHPKLQVIRDGLTTVPDALGVFAK